MGGPLADNGVNGVPEGGEWDFTEGREKNEGRPGEGGNQRRTLNPDAESGNLELGMWAPNSRCKRHDVQYDLRAWVMEDSLRPFGSHGEASEGPLLPPPPPPARF